MDMHLVPDLFSVGIVKKANRDGFGKAIVELGEKDRDVWVLTADVSESTRTQWFAEKFPERFVQVGVAEQNLAGAAAGIAACGKKAFISAFGAFSPGRNFDQIRVSICYNNVDVKVHASHCGLSVGPDGASHQIPRGSRHDARAPKYDRASTMRPGAGEEGHARSLEAEDSGIHSDFTRERCCIHDSKYPIRNRESQCLSGREGRRDNRLRAPGIRGPQGG